MKKGFTLIELLAVILILGIIALIAIPTVNKILNEAKESAFKAGMDNVIKSVKSQCQVDLIKNKEPLLNYTFYKGEFNYKLDIKGALPEEGYINLDNNCEITYYYLTDNQYVYKNTEKIEDQMILESTAIEESIFKTLYTSYYDNIDSISFIDHLNIPSEAIEIKDVSVSGNGKVKSWLISDGSTYKLYIGSNDKIYTNYNTKNLFAYNNVSSLKLDNLYTNFSYKYYCMFAHMKELVSIDLTKFKTENAVNMEYMFIRSKKLSSIIGLENLDVNNVRNFEGVFNDNLVLTTINLSNWNPVMATNMHAMFHCSTAVNTSDLSNFNVSKLELISTLFYSAINLKTLKLSNWDLPTNVITNEITFSSNTKLDYIYLDGASDNTINIIANALKNANSTATNKIIYVDEVKATYPEVTGWTYQQI